MIKDFPVDLFQETVANIASAGVKVAVAESCTGGLLASQLTSIAGASEWFLGGVVSYGNTSKIDLLGVSKETLGRYGAVSEDVAREMALGALQIFGAGVSVSVTGIAGPGGSSVDKVVGTVCFGWAKVGEKVRSEKIVFPGDRSEVRWRATLHAADILRRTVLPDHVA